MSLYSSYSAWEDQQEAMRKQITFEKATAILDEMKIKYKSRMSAVDAEDFLLEQYANYVKLGKRVQFDELLQKYQFDFHMAIRVAIYDLLCKPEERVPFAIGATYYPGILNIENDTNMFTIHTILGDIHVNQANEFFGQKNFSYIFKKELVGRCHIRTFEFVKENQKSYQAVILSSPDYFGGQVYHVYAEGKDDVVDLAANAYYPNKDEASIPLSGEVLAKLSYEEILEEFNKIPESYSFLTKDYGKNKILGLTKYYAHQKDITN